MSGILSIAVLELCTSQRILYPLAFYFQNVLILDIPFLLLPSYEFILQNPLQRQLEVLIIGHFMYFTQIHIQ